MARTFVKNINNKLLLDVFDSLLNAIQVSLVDLSRREKIAKLQNMMVLDPVSILSIEVTMLHIFDILGEYTHDDELIQENIRNSISNCKGTWQDTLRKISSVFWYGYSWSQVAVEDLPDGSKILKEIYTLNPKNYGFYIRNGKIIKIVYLNYMRSVVEIAYNTGIHLVTGSDKNFDYYLGTGRAEAALPYWELHKLIMPVLAVACQRQATPILVKQTETGEDVIEVNQETGQAVIDPDTNEPKTIKKGWDSLQQLEKLGIAGITVIDPDDKLYAIELKVSHDLLQQTIQLCEQQRMTALGVPSTLFTITNSGVGDSGLSDTHLDVFLKNVTSMAEFLSEELVEKLLRPLIVYNFGMQENYGKFTLNTDSTSLEIANTALTAIQTGHKGFDDLDMVNRVRNIIGVPHLTEIENDGTI